MESVLLSLLDLSLLVQYLMVRSGGGVPAKFICTVDDYIERNLKYNLNTKGLSFSEKKKVLMSSQIQNLLRNSLDYDKYNFIFAQYFKTII